MLTLFLLASIIAGECGATVPDARLPIACTVIEDYRRGRDLTTRWYGRHEPTPVDARVARLALQGACIDHRIPYYRFIGNENDLKTWRHLGYVTDADTVHRWTGIRSYTVVGIPERNSQRTLHRSHRAPETPAPIWDPPIFSESYCPPNYPANPNQSSCPHPN